MNAKYKNIVKEMNDGFPQEITKSELLKKKREVIRVKNNITDLQNMLLQDIEDGKLNFRMSMLLGRSLELTSALNEISYRLFFSRNSEDDLDNIDEFTAFVLDKILELENKEYIKV
jgi:hypothetical protein